MHEIRLRDTPQDAWVEQDVNSYLNQALWVMYYGLLLYVLDHGTVPTDLELYRPGLWDCVEKEGCP